MTTPRNTKRLDTMLEFETTPSYVEGAVAALLERGDGRYLAQMFERGIPLHRYQESCDAISKLIRGEAIRKKGRPSLTAADRNKRMSILIFVAQLHGAGMAVFYGENQGRTACDIAAKHYGMKSGKYVYDEIWTPEKDSDLVRKEMEVGRNNKAILTLF